MSLRAGQTLSHYEILSPLGAGAMGEVYRARDSRLDREVAIKVLPEHFAEDAERLRRFEREAKTLASLNHSNVAQIHGVDQVGDTCFLVLELVEGETLEERIARGPLPVDEALAVCGEIAQGLEAAHEAGVIHRDLKPANVRITPEGTVKVLDFGLAKPARPGKESPSSTDSVLSTEAGRLLGTPTYMAPEQARGKSIDRRVDIWAFGCVLYECLTGKRAFRGETLTDVLGAVLHTEPDLSLLPSGSSPRLRELVADCLVKDPRSRARDISEIRRQIERVQTEPAGAKVKKPVSVAATLAITMVAALAGVIATKLLQSKPRESAPPPATRFFVTLPDPVREARDRIQGLALAPDGRTMAVSAHSAHEGIYLRPFGELEPRLLPGTEGASAVCFSPDGRWLAYFDGDHSSVRRIMLEGGRPQTIAPLVDANGLAWSPDGFLATAPQWGMGLQTLNVADGSRAELTKLEAETGDRTHLEPCVLPGGKSLLFEVWTGGEWEQALIKVIDLATREQRVLVRGGISPNYLPFSEREGALLYVRSESLWARPFDPKTNECRGDEVLIVEGIQSSPTSGRAMIALSPSGTLAYQPKVEGLGQSQLWWVDRNGQESPATPEKVDHNTPSLSADGRRLVFARGGAVFTIYSVDLTPPLEQRAARRLTFDFDSYNCLISPDGASMAYISNSSGSYRTYLQDLAGNQPPRVIFDDMSTPTSWSRDGRWIVFSRVAPSGAEIWIVPADGSSPARALVQTKGNAFGARISPDGNWLAYSTDVDGADEISVVTFPAGERRMQVTNGGGSTPRWSLDGGELFYRRKGEYFAMKVTLQPALAFGTPERLFQGDFEGDSDSVGFQQAPDGRFLMNKAMLPADRSLRVAVVQNFAEEVKARLAAAGPR